MEANKGKNLPYFWQNNRYKIIFLFLVIVSILAGTLSRNRSFCTIKGVVQRYTAFFEYNTVKVKGLFKTEAHNRRLMLQLTRLAAMQQQYVSFAEENNRLRRLLNLKEHLPFDVVCADIVKMEFTCFPGYAYLSKGTESKVKKELALIVPDGVVGRIVEAGPKWSRAELLTDPDARISGRVLRTGVRGIVKWKFGDLFEMSILLRSDVKAGDVIVTSGESLIYPGGLLIGRVFKVKQEQDGMFKDVFLRSKVNFQSLEQVFVIIKKDYKSR